MKAIRNITILSALIFVTVIGNELNAQVVYKTKREVRVNKAKRRTIKRKAVRAAHYHYRHLPAWGYRTRVAPAKARVITYNHISYRYLNGVFYKPVGRNYVVVAPPVGLRVTVLPAGFRRVAVVGSSSPYYYYYGTFYRKRLVNGYTRYVVVRAPVGARVAALPDGYTTQYYGDNVYYSINDCHYKTIQVGNETHYEVVAI